MSTIQKYRKRPVVIEATRWDGSAADATRCINWILGSDGEHSGRFHSGGDDTDICISIDTLEGTMQANPGDWILRGVRGEFYPCKPEIFAATYERAQPTSEPKEGDEG